MKKIFKIILFCLIFFVVIICSNINSAFAFDDDSLYYENCNKSILILNDAIQPFKIENRFRSGLLSNAYSDNYAGSYLDDSGLLNIGYVDEVELPTYDNQVIYVKKDYSYNLLLEIQNAITCKMIEYNVSSVALDEHSNEVDVCINDQESRNLLISYLKEINLFFSDAINIIIESENEIIPHKKTAYGGDTINDSVMFFLYSYGTICVNAYDNDTGKYGVLTNAHVADANTTMYHNGNFLQGSKLGTATKRQHSGTIDAAFVPFEDQDNWEVTTHARMGDDVYNNIKLGSRELIIQGAPIRRLGQTTGNTTGHILSTNYNCNISYDGVPTIITNTIKYSTDSEGGDSGGPVYFNGGGQNLFLIGMHFAGPTDPTIEYGVGCNIFNVIDEFNITPMLNGTIYETTDLNENEIRIDKLNPIIPISTDSVSTKFVIPTYLNGKIVTEIGEAAFENQVNVTEFVLPDYLKMIRNSAFKNCSNLTSITIPDTVTHLDSNAFENCSYLQNVTLSNNLTSIGNSAFKGCSSLSNITIPNSVTYLDSNAFENCSYLQSVILSNNLTSIGSSAFKGCSSLSNITIPNSVIHLDSNAFENCSYLQSVILSNNLFAIGNSVFKGCVSLGNIILPSSVQHIDSSAFENCTYLTEVKVLREIADITHLGEKVFDGCSSSLQIIVPQNRLAEYKNKVYWSSYKNKIIPDNNHFDDINLHCLVENSENVSLNVGCNKLYLLNVECNKSYKFFTNSNTEIIIYDENFEKLYTGENILYSYLSVGTYYLDIRYKTSTISGNITINYELRWKHNGEQVYYNDEHNLLTHLHKTAEGTYLNKLYYINNKGAGFYKFYLNGAGVDGASIMYEAGSITIYNESDRLETQVLNKYPNSNTLASSSDGQNIMYVYLPRNGYFYINILMPSNNYEFLKCTISSVESEVIDLFNLSESTNDEVPILDSETTKGDYIKKIYLEQAGKFTVDYSYSGLQSNEILFVLSKLNYNSSSNTYSIETLISQLMDGTNDTFTSTLNLTDGIYFVGYFNKDDGAAFDVRFNRLVTQYDSTLLYTDPDAYTDCGSMINVYEQDIVSYNRSYRSTTIVKGFTRVIYFKANQVTQASRQDYYWYSNDESVATISIHGTVLGVGIGTVKIMAVNIDNPSIVFVKEFTVINDSNVNDDEIVYEISDTHNINDGTYKLGLNVQNSPFPMTQYYTWEVVSKSSSITSVTIDAWGNVTIDGTGWIIIKGSDYVYNPKYSVVLNLIVESE